MRLGRRKGTHVAETNPDEPAAQEAPQEATEEPAEAAAPATGPWDIDEFDGDLSEYVDLGSMLLRPHEGTELRVEVDEESGQVVAVLLVAEEGMLEVRAFAAARGSDLWADVRHEIAADTAQHGGTADEQEGTFGTELLCQMPVQMEDGTSAVQPSRVIGHNGPRWFLRAALLGAPAVDPEAIERWDKTLADIVVRRGRDPMPPGDALPVVLPAEATMDETMMDPSVPDEQD